MVVLNRTQGHDDLRATDLKKLNFNFKVLNRRIFTRRIRIFVDPRGVQINNPFFQYLKFTLYKIVCKNFLKRRFLRSEVRVWVTFPLWWSKDKYVNYKGMSYYPTTWYNGLISMRYLLLMINKVRFCRNDRRRYVKTCWYREQTRSWNMRIVLRSISDISIL